MGLIYGSLLLFFFKHLYWSIIALQVVLVSAVQQSEAVIRIHISTLFRSPSNLGHHRALSRAPCAIQWVLISYLFYT